MTSAGRHRIQGKGEDLFCKQCYHASYDGNRSRPGGGDAALDLRRTKVLLETKAVVRSSSSLSELQDSDEASEAELEGSGSR